VWAAVGTKNAFTSVRYVLTRGSLSRFYFVQENIVNRNFSTLREEDASFAAINLCGAVLLAIGVLFFFFSKCNFLYKYNVSSERIFIPLCHKEGNKTASESRLPVIS